MPPLHAHLQFPSPSTSPGVFAVRKQAAFVRTLLDELERIAPHAHEEAVGEQTIEELVRLGCSIIEAAAALSERPDARVTA